MGGSEQRDGSVCRLRREEVATARIGGVGGREDGGGAGGTCKVGEQFGGRGGWEEDSRSAGEENDFRRWSLEECLISWWMRWRWEREKGRI